MTSTLDETLTLQSMTALLAERGERRALAQIGQGRYRALTYQELAAQARRLAAGLLNRGLEPGDRALLLAPNSPEWVTACIGLLAAGLVPVPVDSQMVNEDLRHVLRDCGARWAFTTASGARRLAELELQAPAQPILLDEADDCGELWSDLLDEPTPALGQVSADDIAVIFYTSGTSGPPKGVPLTHANIVSNIRALLSLNLVRSDDRVLLPLPLHHVYPFVVGLFTPLLVGMTVIVPSSLVGQHFFAALREGQPTILLGVPRLYDALYAAVEARFAARGRVAANAFKSLLRWVLRVREGLGVNPGRAIFWVVRRGVGRRLRLVISGGAALDKEIAARLESLGFRLGWGYGLTETSPILTFRPADLRGSDHVGRPLPGVELRVTEPEAQLEFGEVQARGPNVFSGYLNLPEQNREAFTEDGWFRTGDLGYLDDGGLLHLRGRATSMIVLPGGENVDPEKIEQQLEKSKSISEAGIVEHDGQLSAVIVPAPELARAKDSAALLEEARAETSRLSRELPSYQRPNEVVIDLSPLPRTRLGKVRRPALAARYRELVGESKAAKSAGLAPREALAPLDRELLEDRVAALVWSWLGERFAGREITPDTSLPLDLGVDSLEWLNLSLEIRNRAGIDLTDEAVARIETVRDLLQEAAGSSEAAGLAGDVIDLLREPDDLITDEERRWLKPQPLLGPVLNPLAAFLASAVMRLLFRFRVSGREHLPSEAPLIVAPNHLSALDPIAIAAALGLRRFSETYWGGWVGIMFRSRSRRALSRALRVLPVEPRAGPLSNLALAATVLHRDRNLVWFPEGQRSRDGELQRFRPGIGLLLRAQGATVVPTWIGGTGQALPPGKLLPRPGRVVLRFGPPCQASELESEGAGDTPEARIADALRSRVQALSSASF